MTQTLTQRLHEINGLKLAGDATDAQVKEALRLVDLADAAPDLLDCLDQIVNGSPDRRDYEYAQAAIAKARGEA